MSETGGQSPRDLVFTTMVWDGNASVADLQAHIERMKRHAHRLRIQWPENMNELISRAMSQLGHHATGQPRQPNGLLRMELSRNGELNIEPRAFSLRNEQIEAITVEAPRWSPKVNGTKHGDWQPYLNAMNQADQAGADLALLVHEYAIVDGDRATPMVFDEDSTVWVCGDTQGAVESITASILIPLLEDSGIPVQKGRLNERLVARALEMVAVGSGLGASQIESIDGDAIGKNHGFAIKCQTLLTQHYENKNAWSDVGA